MIRINLLKDTEARRTTARKAKTKASSGRWKIVLPLLVVLGGAGGGAAYYYKLSHAPKPVVIKEQLAEDPGPPATYLNVVEETVQDIGRNKMPMTDQGLLTIAYAEMTLPEKILYGATFLQRALGTINEQATAAIDFNTIQIENFANFYSLGLASSDAELKLFENRLKAISACSDFSIISKSGGGANAGKMKFGMEGAFRFGLDYAKLGEGGLTLADIPGNSELLHVLEQFRDLGRQYGIEWTHIKRDSMTAQGIYQCHVVSIAGSADYKRSVAFLNRLVDERCMVAFPKWTVRAAGGGRVSIEAGAFFYTRPD